MKFLYKAKNGKGDIVTGSVQARNDFEAEKILFDNKLIAMDLIAEKNFELSSFIKFRPTIQDRAVFARQLATMISAGLTLSKAVSVAAANARNEQLKDVYYQVYKDLEEGKNFSTALSSHPEVFDRVFVSVAKAAETTGNLDVVLGQTADRLENDSDFSSKIKGALYYPGFIFLALVGVGVYMLVKIIPQLKVLFDNAKADLPWATRALLSLSDFMQSKWWIALLIIAALYFFARVWAISETGARITSLWLLVIPGIKNLALGIYMTRFSRILEMLIKSGVPLLDALKIVSSTINNVILEEEINNMVVEVERGVPLSTPMQRNDYIPKFVGQMVAVGEQTGKIDQILDKVAEYYENETSTKIKSISSLIEPVVLVIVGLGVAILIFAVLLPIYSLAQLQ